VNIILENWKLTRMCAAATQIQARHRTRVTRNCWRRPTEIQLVKRHRSVEYILRIQQQYTVMTAHSESQTDKW